MGACSWLLQKAIDQSSERNMLIRFHFTRKYEKQILKLGKIEKSEFRVLIKHYFFLQKKRCGD